MGEMQRVAAVLCDIDGVLRIWDSVAEMEREHGFEVGALFATAFRPDLLQPRDHGSCRRRRLASNRNAAFSSTTRPTMFMRQRRWA